MRGDTARAISLAELAREIKQCRISDPRRRSIGRRLQTIVAADGDEAGMRLEVGIHCTRQSQHAPGFDVDRIRQGLRRNGKDLASRGKARTVHHHTYWAGNRRRDTINRVIRSDVGDTGRNRWIAAFQVFKGLRRARNSKNPETRTG